MVKVPFNIQLIVNLQQLRAGKHPLAGDPMRRERFRKSGGMGMNVDFSDRLHNTPHSFAASAVPAHSFAIIIITPDNKNKQCSALLISWKILLDFAMERPHIGSYSTDRSIFHPKTHIATR